MEPNILEKNAKRFISIIDNLNRIEKVIYENEIIDSKTLMEDRDVLDSICHKVLQIYELYSECCFKNKNKYSDNRAKLAHITDKLRNDGLNGFDDIQPDELWNDHFVHAMPQIKNDVIDKIKKVPRLAEKIEELSSSEIKPPIRILEVSDFSHLKVIKDISSKIKNQTICAVGLLNLMSSGSTPPTIEVLFGLVIKIIGCDKEQLEFVIEELIKRGILSQSSSGSYLFIVDEAFCLNATRDFVDSYDLNEIMQLLREEP